MKGLGDMARKYKVPIQTHVSENKNEIEWVKTLHPESPSYSHVYHNHGLLTEKCVMAHGIHLDDDELHLYKESGSGISHCPISNFCIRSGILDVRRLLDQGIKVKN
jgi:guanine deaminase